MTLQSESNKKSLYTINSDGLFVCNDCGKRYKYKNGLSQHQRLECGKEPQFQCPYCDKRCHRKASVKSHIYSIHIDKLKPYIT